MWSRSPPISTPAISKRGLIRTDWIDRFPNRSLPYFSTVVFVVRKGNPKGIKDWPDLVQPGIAIITPNPKTSGNGYLSFFSAWGSVVLRGGSRQQAVDYVTKLYQQVPVLDSGARAATTTFVQKGIGDVHLAWENEAQLEVREAKGTLELVYPPISIRAEPHVAVVDDNVDRNGTRAAAEAYLQFLYSPEGQDVAARNHYRPRNPEIAKKYEGEFAKVSLFTIDEVFGGWKKAQAAHFNDDGMFDQIYTQ